MPEPQTTTKTSSPILIAAAWLVVLVPTAWGLNYTVRNAVKIFDRAPTPSATSAPR
jgi:hypothetical protein